MPSDNKRIVLSNREFIILSEEELATLQSDKETTFVLDGHGARIASHSAMEAKRKLERLTLHEHRRCYNWPLPGDENAGNKALKTWKSEIRFNTSMLLPGIAISLVLLIWGRSDEGIRLYVTIPLWVFSFFSLVPSIGLIRPLWPVFICSTICSILWPVTNWQAARLIGFASCVLPLVFILFYIPWFKKQYRLYISSKDIYERLANRTPQDAVSAFYSCLPSLNREKALQYLAAFRRSEYIPPESGKDYAHWNEPTWGAPTNLYCMADKLIEHLAVSLNVSSGELKVLRTVFLKSAELDGPVDRVYAISVFERWDFYETWTSPTYDWDVKTGSGHVHEIKYDCKMLVRFDNGWFVENHAYSSPPEADVQQLVQQLGLPPPMYQRG